MNAADPARAPASPSHKVREAHLRRDAAVYVRQSTTHQVLNNRESADRQYALKGRAASLGWPEGRVHVIDDDLGRSGQDAAGRPGFQRLLAEIALDRVGIVLALEMSRLARSCKDWHHLLELCSIFGTLLADADGVYDPRDYNDRLLLGLKGAMSEAEIHLLKGRMNEGLLNRARRGEVFSHAPVGYVRAESGLALDPDEQARDVVRQVFDGFERLGSAQAVLRDFVARGVKIPVRPIRGEGKGTLVWRRPNRVTLHGILTHPVYAGFYRWGHRAVDPRKKVPGRPQSGRRKLEPGQCAVLLPGRCPAYISEERFRANQRRLHDNRSGADTPGAARHGPSLLGGILSCGVCGCRLMVNYNGGGRHLRYVCARGRCTYAEPECQSLAGHGLDALVAGQVLEALGPAALELHLAAAADVEGQRRLEHEDWGRRLERARYEAGRARRQYELVEPENRLVARELERAWEAALAEQGRLEGEYERLCQARPRRLSDGEREAIRALAGDLPGLWEAATTTAADRQRVVRLLVERVVVRVEGKSERVDVAIHWAGGCVTRHEAARTVGRYEQMSGYPRLCAFIDGLRAGGASMDEVARRLNAEGFRPPKKAERFTGGMVWGLLARRCEGGAGAGLARGEWLLGPLAAYLGMPQATLHRWRKAGWVSARKLDVPGGQWAILATGPERRRMGRLRRFVKEKPNQPIPAVLTTPAARE